MSLKRFQRKLVRVLTVLVILSILFCLGLYAYRSFFGFTYDSSLFGKNLAAGVKADENITNIALFGLDTREGDTQSHSDCMMIVTVDNTRGKIKLISLMRDSLVNISEHGEDKLNAAYFLGGPSLAIRTINENFGTDITEYIAVNFEQLVEIIDALGGVEINVETTAELLELNRVIRDYGIEQGKEFSGVEETGLQTLDGVQALCYGRIRKGGTGDDWARVERQSIVLQAMFTKVQSMGASELIGLMQKIVPYVTTSLNPTEIAPLIVGAVKNGVPTLEHARVPLDSEWNYYGASSEYILYDLDVAADHIHEYIYNDVYPGETASDSGTDTDTSNGPLGGVDYDEPPTAPPTTDDTSSSGSTVDPASLAEEGGRYDPATGDYYDSDGDRYYLDESGSRVYY
ncbi:LCP family protein [Candidatus Agathobaculum pullicola]|uniref:LCP family protein n=1 Tax=Candidatus Agathobaculum pullicola TaxID=2838426 RepID=UPI003F930DC4